MARQFRLPGIAPYKIRLEGGTSLMNWFDLAIFHFINSFAHRSWVVDAILVEISENNFLDGGVLMAMFWWAWIKYGKERPEKRELLAANLAIVAFAVIMARLFALTLPYRERPIRNPLLHFQHPFTTHPATLIHWSSFPSDHAVLAFCVATGLWIVSRRLGTVAIVYALMTNLPRIYAGTHYPTDFLAGALLGSGFAFLSKVSIVRTAVRNGLAYLDQHPAFLYAVLFAWTFEIGEMFNSLRHIAVLGARTILLYPARQVEEIAIPLLVLLLCALGWLRWKERKLAA